MAPRTRSGPTPASSTPTSERSASVLDIERLVVRYGAATALDGVDLRLDTGEMVALVGPNGAGKTTLVNAVSGLVPIASGRIDCNGRVAQVPEGRQMFPDLT